MTEIRLMKFLETEIHHGHLNERKRIKRTKDQEVPFRKSKSKNYHGLMVRKDSDSDSDYGSN